MAEFFAELKRRHIYRVGAAYAVLAWLLLQIVNNVAPVLDLPPWVARAFVLLLVIGFPVALFFAWMRELAPADSEARRVATTSLDYVLTAALALVIALVSYQQLRTLSGEQAARLASLDPTRAVSLAVLPFTNLSSDPEQEFFSDGITEEITAALARVPDLRVVARTSAFQFKGQNRDIQGIAQQLRATHVIEGSVRTAGERVRITAQLVSANDGTHLWSENYDRELTDIFAIQEEIARAIAASLRMPLGLGPGQNLVSNRTENTESYQDYLRGRAAYRGRNMAQALSILESAVERDPNYAPGWAMLATAYTVAPAYTVRYDQDPVDQVRAQMESLYDRAEQAAREAIRLDERQSAAYYALGLVDVFRRGNWAEGEDLFKQALALDPNDADALHLYTFLVLSSAGKVKEAVGARQRLRELEPFVPTYNIFTADPMLANGQTDDAIALLESVAQVPATSYYRNATLAKAYAAKGRFSQAADTLLAISPETRQVSRRSIEDAARLLRAARAPSAAPASLPAIEGEFLNFVYVYAGAPERAMEAPERGGQISGNGYLSMSAMWNPLFASLRKTERFKAYVQKVGLVDYWRARGWPDLCRPAGADDFECE